MYLSLSMHKAQTKGEVEERQVIRCALDNFVVDKSCYSYSIDFDNREFNLVDSIAKQIVLLFAWMNQ